MKGVGSNAHSLHLATYSVFSCTKQSVNLSCAVEMSDFVACKINYSIMKPEQY